METRRDDRRCRKAALRASRGDAGTGGTPRRSRGVGLVLAIIAGSSLALRAEAGLLDLTCSASASFTTTPDIGLNDLDRDPAVGTAQQLSCAAGVRGSADTLNPIDYDIITFSAPGRESTQTIEPPEAYAHVTIAVDGSFLNSPAGRVRATAGQDWFFTILCLPEECAGGNNIEVQWKVELSQSSDVGVGAAVVRSELITAFSEATLFTFQARSNRDGSITYLSFGGSQRRQPNASPSSWRASVSP